MIHSLKQWLALLGLAIFLSACGQHPVEDSAVYLQGHTMGTTYHITLADPKPGVDKAELQQQLDLLLEQLNQQMSTYRPESELSRFNRAAAEFDFAVSSETAKVITEAIRLGDLTDGALDVTVGPLVNLWGFGPNARPEVIPTSAEIEAARGLTGLDKLSVVEGKLRKAQTGLYVDLSSIAKGYGVDLLAEHLQQLGYQNYMVEIGGELRVRGVNGKQKPWRIAVEKPVIEERAIEAVIEPTDLAVATSGDYRNYFEENGRRYSHTIDPATGMPIAHKLVSATVLDPSCMTADGLATALMVMGPERGRVFAQQHGLAVILISKTDSGFARWTSDAAKPYVR